MAYNGMGLQVQVCEEVPVQVSMLSQEARVCDNGNYMALDSNSYMGPMVLEGGLGVVDPQQHLAECTSR